MACLSYDLTGDLTEKGTVVGSMSEAKTCADWVEGSVFGGKPVLKMPTAGGISDGKFLGLKGNVREFAGAGTYPKAQLPNVAVSLGSEGKYELVDASTASLTVKPDGSGSLTFGDYRGEDGAAGTVSGTVTWTCHDPGA